MSEGVSRALPQRKSELTPTEQELVIMCQRTNFGRMRNLVIRGGQPVFDPPPVIQRDHKFGGQNGPRAESGLDDFVLKQEFVDLLRRMREIGDGTIVNLEIRAGKPFMMTEEAAA